MIQRIQEKIQQQASVPFKIQYDDKSTAILVNRRRVMQVVKQNIHFQYDQFQPSIQLYRLDDINENQLVQEIKNASRYFFQQPVQIKNIDPLEYLHIYFQTLYLSKQQIQRYMDLISRSKQQSQVSKAINDFTKMIEELNSFRIQITFEDYMSITGIKKLEIARREYRKLNLEKFNIFKSDISNINHIQPDSEMSFSHYERVKEILTYQKQKIIDPTKQHHLIQPNQEFRYQTSTTYFQENPVYSHTIPLRYVRPLQSQTLKSRNTRRITKLLNKQDNSINQEALYTPVNKKPRRMLSGTQHHTPQIMIPFLQNFQNDIQYLQVLNLVPAVINHEITNSSVNPLDKALNKANQLGLADKPFTQALVSERNTNPTAVDVKQDIYGRVAEALQHIDIHLPYTEEQIRQALVESNSGQSSNRLIFMPQVQDNTLQNTIIKKDYRTHFQNLITSRGFKDGNITLKQFGIVEEIIIKRLQGFFTDKNIQDVKALVDAYNNLKSLFIKNPNKNIANSLNQAKEELSRIQGTFLELYEEAKILIAGGSQILSYIETKKDWNKFKDTEDVKYSVDDVYNLGSTYVKEFFLLASDIWHDHVQHVSQLIKYPQDHSKEIQELTSLMHNLTPTVYDTVTSYYLEFRNFLRTEVFQKIKSYFVEFFPVLQTIVQITTGLDLYKAGTIIQYAQQAINIIDHWIINEETTKSHKEMQKADDTRRMNDELRDKNTMNYFNNNPRPN